MMIKTIVKAIFKIIAVVLGLFAATFTVYMLNLDMKLMAFAEPYVEKVYDLRKDRERKI